MRSTIFSLLLLVISPSFSAFAEQGAVLTCAKLELFQPETQPQWKPTGVSVLVQYNNAGNYGYSALVSSPNGKADNLDVKVETLRPEQVSQLKEMVTVMLPGLVYSSIAYVRVGNVGVQANQQDGSGIMILQLLDTQMRSLGKLATMGWSFGRCSL